VPGKFIQVRSWRSLKASDKGDLLQTNLMCSVGPLEYYHKTLANSTA
jgi:hypothetical protein